ncbi:MAG: hypothetical protein Q4E35_10690 [Eubacteriales bacterium]|nr:hypothetical protein [Eubacteriales bacterium]
MKMQKAEMKFIHFEAEDVITTSGGYVTFAGFGDSDKSNNTISFSGEPYNFFSTTKFVEKLNKVFKTDKFAATMDVVPNVKISNIAGTFSDSSFDSSKYKELNGTWKWINEQFVKQTQ